MKIGDLVWNNYQGLMRFGTIVSKRLKEDKWAHYTVEWHDDETYEDSMAWRKKLSGEDHTLKEYRAGFLKTISKDKLEKVIEEHEQHLRGGDNEQSTKYKF